MTHECDGDMSQRALYALYPIAPQYTTVLYTINQWPCSPQRSRPFDLLRSAPFVAAETFKPGGMANKCVSSAGVVALPANSALAVKSKKSSGQGGKKIVSFVTAGERGRVRVWRSDTGRCLCAHRQPSMWSLIDNGTLSSTAHDHLPVSASVTCFV